MSIRSAHLFPKLRSKLVLRQCGGVAHSIFIDRRPDHCEAVALAE
jgi:hypothetical protein